MSTITDTQKSISLIWSVVGVTTLYVSINIYFFSHGSEFFLPSIKLGKTDYYSASFYGIFFTSPLIFITHYLTRLYVKHYPRKVWFNCLPTAFNINLSELPNFLKHYQIFFFIGFCVFPSLLHIDYVNKFFHGTVYIESTKKPILVAWEQFTLDFSIYKHGVNNFRFGDIGMGIDYYPIIFPIGVLIIESIHIWSLIATMRIISLSKNTTKSHKCFE